MGGVYQRFCRHNTRIARDLHDTLLQTLAGVSLQLDGVAKQISPSSEAAAAPIRVVRRRLEASFREARQKVQDLRSPMLTGHWPLRKLDGCATSPKCRRCPIRQKQWQASCCR